MVQIVSCANSSYIPHPLVYGPGKIGKTYLATTAEQPIIIDTDAGTGSLLEFPNIPRIPCPNWQTFETEIFPWVMEDRNSQKIGASIKQFKTVFIDDLTELAEQFLVAEKPKHKNLMQAYGTLNDRMGELIRTIRVATHITFVTICKRDRIQDGTTGGLIYGPMIAGRALGPQIPHLFGEIYHMEFWTNPNDGKAYRMFRTRRDAASQYEAGTRSSKLHELEYANVKHVLDKIRS